MRMRLVVALLLLSGCAEPATSPTPTWAVAGPPVVDSIYRVCTIYIDYTRGRYWEICPRAPGDSLP